jgi:hypothetical protein
MTRKSRREIERKVESLSDDGGTGGVDRIIIETTVVGTEWEPPEGDDHDVDLGPGETRTRTRELELGGSNA